MSGKKDGIMRVKIIIRWFKDLEKLLRINFYKSQALDAVHGSFGTCLK